MKVSSFFVSL